jgi:hypothetical protein
VDVPLPRSRLGPAGPAGGALFGGVSKWPESIHVCGVDGPSPRIDLAPPQPLRTRGHFLRNPWISARRRPHWPSPPRVNSSNKN